MFTLKLMSMLIVRRRMIAPAVSPDLVGRFILGRVGRLGARIGSVGVAWAETCADYHRAAFLYENLRRRSDVALRNCGLSRARLAWEIAQACDRLSGVAPQGGQRSRTHAQMCLRGRVLTPSHVGVASTT
jgi:hypothetical protein